MCSVCYVIKFVLIIVLQFFFRVELNIMSNGKDGDLSKLYKIKIVKLLCNINVNYFNI